MIILKQGEIFSPEEQGTGDILIGAGGILQISGSGGLNSINDARIVDCSGNYVIPGLVDSHVHIIGGGGEGGPTTRTPELKLSQLIEGGITTVVGCLGTDGFTRDLKALLMKAKALRLDGFSCWIYTGSYQFPPPTFFGDVTTDIMLIEEVIGVGEIAVSDHRSSNPSSEELIRLAKQTRLGGMLAGKAGIINLHMGDSPDPFRIVEQVVGSSELDYKQFIPTHCNRNTRIFNDAKDYGKKGFVDLTASSYHYYPDLEIKVSRAVQELVSAEVPWENITVTSDGCGSLPQFNDRGELEKLIAAEPASIYREFKDLVEDGVPICKALLPFTSNPAGILRLPGKGKIAEGHDADLLVLDHDLKIRHMISKGRLIKEDYEIKIKENFS